MQVQLKKQLHPAEIFSGRNSKKKVWISMNCWTVYCSYKCAFLYLKDEVINIPTSLSTLKNKGMYPLYYQCFKKLFFLIKIFIIEIYFYFFFYICEVCPLLIRSHGARYISLCEVICWKSCFMLWSAPRRNEGVF